MELLEKREVYEFAPSFVARENFPEYSLRAYVHKESLKHAYENDPKVAIAHAIDVYDEWDDFSNEGHQYGIALVRGFGAKRIVDFHLYKGLDIDDTPHQWRNSEPSGTHIQIYDRGKVRDIECYADNNIILGAEEMYRRITPNFKSFMNNAPLLGNIGLRVTQ